jgi:hypothetical protein
MSNTLIPPFLNAYGAFFRTAKLKLSWAQQLSHIFYTISERIQGRIRCLKAAAKISSKSLPTRQ